MNSDHVNAKHWHNHDHFGNQNLKIKIQQKSLHILTCNMCAHLVVFCGLVNDLDIVVGAIPNVLTHVGHQVKVGQHHPLWRS